MHFHDGDPTARDIPYRFTPAATQKLDGVRPDRRSWLEISPPGSTVVPWIRRKRRGTQGDEAEPMRALVQDEEGRNVVVAEDPRRWNVAAVVVG